MLFAFVSGSVFAQQASPALLDETTIPAGTGQLEFPPQLFPGGVDDQGNDFFFNGQPATNGKLILTASNGFFDNGTCRASGESSLPKIGDDDLIKPNFAQLNHWKSTAEAIRWHVWIPQTGRVHVSVNLNVAPSAAGSKITVSFAGQQKKVTTVASSHSNPQPWRLAFDVQQAGRHTIALQASEIADKQDGIGQLYQLDVHGPAIAKAKLLRARWRPAAVQGGYSCSATPQSRMWVMTTRSVCDFSSYSPITTPFGYFGTSFLADGRSKGGFNFSMWAASAKGKIPPLGQMPHLLAAGSREAEFSGFGHEGSGVKLRGWIPMPDQPKVCVQALRVESEGEYDTYHGYFWDHPTAQWKLYAVGRKWNKGKPKDHLSPGSFCEIPGPPQVQRTGDMVREVRRQGWHWGTDDRWHAMDQFNCKSKKPSNKFWNTTADGEFAMGTGGMRYYAFKQPGAPKASAKLPAFLGPIATKQLFRLPAVFANVSATNIADATASITVDMKQAGSGASVVIYFGEIDCLTFARRQLHATERKSAVSQSTQALDRSWSNRTDAVPLRDGSNQVELTGLKPGTRYFYRAMVTNNEGKIWMGKTQSFHTK